MLELNKNNMSLVDIIINSEHFASLCGFDYPIGEYKNGQNYGHIHLVAEQRSANHNERIKYGLMVWHNRNYVPEIGFEKTNQFIQIKINNEATLPYPAIQRTKAWLEGLEYFLNNQEAHSTDTKVEQRARTIFLEGIYEAAAETT